jgi:hypothetical protein
VGDDDDAMDNEDWLMSEDVAEDLPTALVISDIDDPDGPGAETVQVIGSPELHLMPDAVCVVLRAFTSGGDSTEKLEDVEIELVDEGDVSVGLRREIPPRWSAFPTDDGLVAGKTWACFRPGPEQCEMWRSLEGKPVGARYTIHATGIQAFTGAYLIDTRNQDAILGLCDGSPAAP